MTTAEKITEYDDPSDVNLGALDIEGHYWFGGGRPWRTFRPELTRGLANRNFRRNKRGLPVQAAVIHDHPKKKPCLGEHHEVWA